MSDTVILILGPTPDAPLKWASWGAEGVADAGEASNASALGDIAGRLTAARRVVAILPGEDVAMRSIPSPPRNAAKFRAAATFLLEDELAESLEHLHVVTQATDDRGVALAVKKSVMDAWLEAFAEAGIAPDIVTADFALLPGALSKSVFLIEANRAVGAVAGAGFAAERPFADGLVASLIKDAAADHVVIYSDAEDEPTDIAGKTVEWRSVADPNALFELFSSGIDQQSAPNFLQGVYRKRRDWRLALGGWRRAGMLAAACLAAVTVTLLADGLRSSRIASGFDKMAQTVHDSAFPEAAGRDPLAHARTVLSTQSSAPAFLALATTVADAVDATEDIQVDRIRFNASRAEFSVNLRFGDINDLEALKGALRARGVVTRETGDVRRSGGTYLGELQVSQS